MPSNFPNSADAFTTKTAHVSVNAAADVNNLQDAVLAIETSLLSAPNPNGLDYVSKSRPDTVTGVKSFSAAPIFNAGATFPSSAGVVAMGTGDDVPYFTLNGTAWEMTSQQGTTASPIATGTGPNVKISRTESIPATTMPAGNGANNEGNAGLWISALGDAANEAQVSGLVATARNQSTKTRTAGAINIDATAIQGFGNVFGSGTGNAIGGYFEGRIDSAVAGSGANAAEFRCNNQSGSDHSYTGTGFSPTTGVWVTAGSSATPGRVCGAAIAVALTNSCQWDVGLGFTTIGGVSSCKTATISDDSSSTTSIRINGTHTNSIVIANTGGPMLVGGLTALSGNTDTRLELQAKTAGGTDPVLFIGSTTAAVNHTVWLRNSVGVSKLGIVGAANQLLSSSAAGDLAIFNSTANKRVLLGGTTAIFSVANANTLAFFGKVGSEVAQQSAAGTATGYAAGATAATFHSDDTYTGNTGATGYTVNGIVAALKNYGLLAA